MTDYIALAKIVADRTQLEIWRRLSKEDRKAFAALVDPEEIDKFMKEKVHDIKSLIELSARVTMEKFKSLK